MENAKNNKRYDNRKRKNKYKNEERYSSISLHDKRIIYLDGEINDSLASKIVQQLLRYDMCNHKDITIYINSPGGSVTSGFAIYDMMNKIKSDVRTIGIGRCSSMASILLINGAKGKRFILPNAEVMIHEVSSCTVGNISEMQEKFEHTKVLNERIFKIISTKTKMKVSQIKKYTANKDHWLNSNRALQYGFVDKILR